MFRCILRRRPGVYSCVLLLGSSVLLFLLVVTYNGLVKSGHSPISHNGVLAIQQKVLKFELRARKGDNVHDHGKVRNSSEESYQMSYSNFSDDENKERPSDITGDNAKEVRVSSSTDDEARQSYQDDNDEDDDVDEHKDDDNGEIRKNAAGSKLNINVAVNHIRGLNAHEEFPKHTYTQQQDERTVLKMDKTKKAEKIAKKKVERGLKRTYWNEWNEYDREAWRELPLVTGSQNTELQTGEAVVYNRVGKCGSRSVINVLKQLALKNHFHLVSSLVYNSTRLSSQYQQNMVDVLKKLERPYVFQRHVHFIDFSRYGVEQPRYINIIRDPLSRMVSQYYFLRFGDGRGERLYSGDDKYQTFDECVLKEKEECFGKRSCYITPFFCGQDPRCRECTSWSLNQAMRNVEDHYVALGVLEELEDTFKVFEAVLPDTFNGALDIYRKTVAGEMRTNITDMITKHKVKPSAKVIQIMREHLHMEYTFFEFAKARFHKQKKELGIS